MRIDVVTIFPEYFAGPLDAALLGKARANGVLDVEIHDLRAYTSDKHRTVDDEPFGGGPGMVMKPGPIFAAAEAVLRPGSRVVLLSPRGRVFTQVVAHELARAEHLVLICGHYEGVDERVREHLATDELSIGDYVLAGGELAAMVIVDAVARLVPGVIDPASVAEESHTGGVVEYPHYTRPEVYRGLRVPEVLLSGHHGRVRAWREEAARERTGRVRPDLLNSRRDGEETA